MAVNGFQEWKVDKPWLELKCALGEGPFYEKETNTLRLVDIKKKQILTVSLDDSGDGSSLKTIQLDVCPTVTADIEGVDPQERILIGVKHGLAVLDRQKGTYELLAPFNTPEHNERIRANDGAADPNGKFWLGTMTDFGQGPNQPEGFLARFDSSKSKEEVLKDLVIPNGIGWSPDNKTMYFTHSQTREVFAFDYAPETGAVSNQRLWYRHEGPGEPDGFRVDVEGNVWHAVWGEGAVLKIDPQGRVIGRIALPTRHITCVQFVGTELLITSAADEEADADETSRRFGGDLFRVDVGTRGLELFKFRL
ncbi:uncharacterized protein TRIREDRAFT_22284 [Trichoderma reesei QM6a]|uniref:Predicted protein n=2 Tax=Hypocrea jecorina TaxID=51453 RepID=G0RJB3_HYPJQ|nr:uncharacterized protein TRIREDRAFT_22284 [Trichoderma reesei QM6a]EGR48560.1 predicted protein [Trichoderma reesei QM6a]ETS01434.1 hypothetical protein M419DRAFT_99640 [Trichoderma reesei RUT C-30]